VGFRDTNTKYCTLKNAATTYVELLVGISIICMIFGIVLVGVNGIVYSKPRSYYEKALCTEIRIKSQKLRNEATNKMESKCFKINSKTIIHGFKFIDKLVIHYNCEGNVTVGSTTKLERGSYLYEITIRPVTGVITLRAINRYD